MSPDPAFTALTAFLRQGDPDATRQVVEQSSTRLAP
jgi:hypothetical protein